MTATHAERIKAEFGVEIIPGDMEDWLRLSNSEMGAGSRPETGEFD